MRGRLVALGLLALVGLDSCALVAAPRPPALPLGELLLVGFSGTAVPGNDEIRHLVCDIKVGGVILFERDVATGKPRNLTSPEQVRRLTTDLQALANFCVGRPLFIAADNEGGRVMRLSPRLGFPPSPSAQELGETNDVDATRAEARQLVSHKAITVNGQPVNIPSYLVKPGDVVAVREKSKKQTRVNEALQLAQQIGIPGWVEVNADKAEGVFKKVPDRDEFGADINESLIVELYSR